MRDLLAAYDRLAVNGPVGRAVVTRVWGSAPRQPGAVLFATAQGTSVGSVSGGCVETAVVDGIGRAMSEGRPSLMTFAVSDERAWEVGLACGGTIDVFVEPEVRPELLAAARNPEPSVVPTIIAGALPLGTVESNTPLESALAEPMRKALEDGRSRCAEIMLDGDETTVFLEAFPTRPTIVIVGAVHIAQHLAAFAKPLGYRIIVTDGRENLLTRERFPDADDLRLGWPEDTLGDLPLGRATAICILSHDPKFDDPAMRLALRSEAGYIGAIGSKRTQAGRRRRLEEEGFGDSDLARIHGPIGLDIGAREPAEIALAILAEITAVRGSGTS